MKKIIGLMLVALVPTLVLAQSKSVVDFNNKYATNDDVTHVIIKGPLFKFLASFADYDDDPEAKALANMADGIKSMEILQVPYYETNLKREEVAMLRSQLSKEEYEEFLSVKEGKELVNILAQGKEDELRNMLILVEEKEEFTLISINGTLSMKDLSYLSRHHESFH